MKKNNYLKRILKLTAVCTCCCFFGGCVSANPSKEEKCEEKSTRVLSNDIPTNFDGTSNFDNAFFILSFLSISLFN